MTPHEKAVSAINTRLERLQANLSETQDESARRFLFQSILVTIALAEGLNDYVKMVGRYAERRQGEIKQAIESLGAEHARMLNDGREMLERFKSNPSDRALQKELEALQQKMAAVQKNLRRDANALQRELAPSLGLIDPLAVNIRRLAEADEPAGLLRGVKAMIAQVRELYAAQPDVSADLVDTAGWEKAANDEITATADYYDAYARAGYQSVLALEWLALALAEQPPQSAEEVTTQANEAAAAKLKAITARVTG